MTIGELFLKLGVKGADAAKRSLDDVRKGMSDIGSSSLATKAAILGAMAAVERLTGMGSQVAMDMYKFTKSTGESTDVLQKWQYALGLYDVPVEQTTGVLTSIKNAFAQMQMGGGPPPGLALLAESLGGLDQAKVNAGDVNYIMSKLVEASHKLRPDIFNQIVKSFGGNEGLTAALASVNMQTDKLKKSEILSPKQITQGMQINKMWKDSWYQLKILNAQLVANHGAWAVGEVNDMIHGFEVLVQDFDQFSSKMPTLTKGLTALGIALTLAFAGVSPQLIAITAAIAGILKLLDAVDKSKPGDLIYTLFKGGAGEEIQDKKFKEQEPQVEATARTRFYQSPAGQLALKNATPTEKEEATQLATGKQRGFAFNPNYRSFLGAVYNQQNNKPLGESVIPNLPTQQPTVKEGHTINQTITNNIHEAHNPRETASEVQKQITKAHRQIAAQVGGI